MYRLSEHSLAVERDHHRLTWLSREDSIAMGSRGAEGAAAPPEKSELKVVPLLVLYLQTGNITSTHNEFENKSNIDKIPYLKGGIPQCAITAARFVAHCHEKTATYGAQKNIVNTTSTYVYYSYNSYLHTAKIVYLADNRT